MRWPAYLVLGIVLFAGGAYVFEKNNAPSVGNHDDSVSDGPPIFTDTSPPPPPAPPPLDLSRPVFTDDATLICPQSLFFDVREGHGIQGLNDALLSIFHRSDKFAALGCEEWQAGVRVYVRKMDPPFEHFLSVAPSANAPSTLFSLAMFLRN